MSQKEAATDKKRPLFKNLFSSLRHRKPSQGAKPQLAPLAPAPVNSSIRSPSPSTLSRASSASSSLARSSADPDASVRSMAPSTMQDKAEQASVASSSQISTQRTTRSGHSASTKPTTTLSLASDTGANRIAQSRNSGASFGGDHASPVFARLPSSHTRRDSAATTASQVLPSSSSIQFSSLPSTAASPTTTVDTTQHAPFFTLHNPRNNPSPGSPALDNASTLTLASSTGMALGREGSLYQTRIDENASIRALPPSRRESQSSLNSKYSAAALFTGPSGPASFYLRDGARPASLRTVATTKSADLVARSDKRRSAATMEELSPPSPGQPPSHYQTQPLESPAAHSDVQSQLEAPPLLRKDTDWTVEADDMETAPSTPFVERPEPVLI